MIHDEAVELAAYAKELFPRTTDAQSGVLRDLCRPFPDQAFVRDALKRLATEQPALSIPLVRTALEAELRRRGLTTADEAKPRDRQQGVANEAYWRAADAFIADLTDEDLVELKADALTTLEPAGAEFESKRDVRRSRVLKGIIFDRAHGVPHA